MLGIPLHSRNIRILVIIAFLSSFAYAQQKSPNDLLKAKDYAGYLSETVASPKTVKPGQQAKDVKFTEIVPVAIALDKTHGWQGEQEKQLRAKYADIALTLKRLDALKVILAGDTSGVVTLYSRRDEEPDFTEVGKCIPLLREHDYPLAANVLETLNRDLNGKRIIAWLSIPKEKRKPVDDLMLAHYGPGSMNRRALVDIAWELYKKPPKDCAIPEDAFFDFAIWFGKDTGKINFDAAAKLYYDGKKDGAVKLLEWLVNERPADLTLARKAAAFMMRADKVAALAFYRRLLASGKEPYLREIRLDYLEALRDKRLTSAEDTVSGFQQSADALFAVDALLIEAKYDEAAKKAQSVTNDEKADIGRRVAAWSAWMDSDPAAAIAAVEPLLKAVESCPDAALRAQYVTWLGWQLSRVAGREIPLKQGQIRTSSRKECRPIRIVRDWPKQFAAIMDRLLAIDPAACLVPGDDGVPTLRYTAALVYSLAGDDKSADEISKREITYMKQPPPAGWPGPRDKDSDKPRETTSPQKGERERLMLDLTGAMGRHYAAEVSSPTAKIPAPPPNLGLTEDLANQLAVEKNKDEVSHLMGALSLQFATAIAYLDPPRKGLRLDQPPPEPREVDMTYVKSLQTSLRTALKNDLAANSVKSLMNDGFIKSMLSASNPELLSALCDSTEEALDRFSQATTDTTLVSSYADNVARSIESRKVYDMKPYAERLHKKYPDVK